MIQVAERCRITLTPFGARPFSRAGSADRSLVDKHQPGGIKKTLLWYPTPGVRAPHYFAAVRQVAGRFLRVMLWRSRNARARCGWLEIRCLRSSATERQVWMLSNHSQDRPQTLQAAKHFRRSASARRCYHRASAAAT